MGMPQCAAPVGILTGASDDAVLRIGLAADPPTITIEASKRRPRRTLGTEAAARLLSEHGARIDGVDHDSGWTARVELAPLTGA